MPSFQYSRACPSAAAASDDELRELLQRLYRKYNRFERIKPDPLQFVYRYSNPRDMEIAAFLAAALAYGRVAQIERSVDNLLGRMGSSPFEFVLNFDNGSEERLTGFKHRFNTAADICDLLALLRSVLHRCGSVEACFVRGLEPSDPNIIGALSRFVSSLLREHQHNTGSAASKGLRYLLSDPVNRSCCKRLNLFLRWMVRSDDVDPGLWKSVDKAKLIVPVDTHMARLCRILGLYDSKTVSLAAALQITAGLARIERNDPVKYDFALSRVGIVEDCNGRYRPACDHCGLLEFCRKQGSF